MALDFSVPFREGFPTYGPARLFKVLTVTPSLIRNLAEAFSFGTLRVIEKGRDQRRKSEEGAGNEKLVSRC